jgi:hypothetical protein
MQPYGSFRLLMVAVLALCTTACAHDPQPGTPEAAAASERLMRSMSDTLAHAKAFTFETTERIEVNTPSGEKRALNFTRKTVVQRPNALFFELHGQTGEGFDLRTYYHNETLTLNDNRDGNWAQTTVPGNLDDMLDDVIRRFGLPVPIGDLVSSSPYDALVGKSARGGLVAWETIGHVRLAKLDYADEFVEVRIWIPKSGPALPRRLEIVYKQAPVPLVTQLDFTDWNFDVPVAVGTFDFKPSAERGPVVFRDLVSVMVARSLPREVQEGEPAAAEGQQHPAAAR